MDKLDMVIKGLQHCMMSSDRYEFETQCEDCPYFDPEVTVEECMEPLKDDAIELLKEQEERIKLLEHQLETITKWRMNAGAFD